MSAELGSSLEMDISFENPNNLQVIFPYIGKDTQVAPIEYF